MGDLTMKLGLPTRDRFFENPVPLGRDAGELPSRCACGQWLDAAAAPGGKDGLENAVARNRQ